MTDCGRTPRQRVPYDPEFAELKLLFERGDGAAWPPTLGKAFNPPWVFFRGGRETRFRLSL
jgi:hypothetical protein